MLMPAAFAPGAAETSPDPQTAHPRKNLSGQAGRGGPNIKKTKAAHCDVIAPDPVQCS
jgi:hypothetical protein